MPVFAFAFGCFGDILATAQLVAMTVIFLHRSGKQSKECAETEKELKSLGNDLAHLTIMSVDAALPTTSPVALSFAARIQAEVIRCHKIMARFFTKISASRGLLQKMVWAVSEEKELAAFRMQVVERRTALGLVVGLMNSGALVAVRDRIDEVGGQVRSGNQKIQDGVSGLAKQLTDLDIQDRIGQLGGQVRVGDQNIQEGVRNLAKQLTDIDSAVQGRVNEVGHQVRSGANQIEESVNGLAKQLATYQQQIIAIINHVPHGVSEVTFVVIPPAGIPIPISLMYCNTLKVSRSYLHSWIFSSLP
ncbi:hypothetical protein C8R44DRAFT_71771 [Mycena epipterygia]|nr:hypothetical protein C8R44DRAFT_71771 [Mycena epipterygia]